MISFFDAGKFALSSKIWGSTIRLFRTATPLVFASIIFSIGIETAHAESIKWGSVLADDYDRGVAEHKPIVVLFYDITTSRYDADMLSTQISLSTTLGKFAGSAIWSFADVSNSLVAKNIAKALGITTFPSISVLRPNGEALYEAFRVVGVLPIGTTEIGVMRGIEKASKK